MSKSMFTAQLHRHLLANFFADLQKEGQTTLENMLHTSWDIAKSVVVEGLKDETERYDSEGEVKNHLNRFSDEELATTLAPLLNFFAFKAAMLNLHSIVTKSHM